MPSLPSLLPCFLLSPCSPFLPYGKHGQRWLLPSHIFYPTGKPKLALVFLASTEGRRPHLHVVAGRPPLGQSSGPIWGFLNNSVDGKKALLEEETGRLCQGSTPAVTLNRMAQLGSGLEISCSRDPVFLCLSWTDKRFSPSQVSLFLICGKHTHTDTL